MVIGQMLNMIQSWKSCSETDANARWQLMIDAEKIMMDDLCYIPVFEKGTATLQNTKVKNLGIKPVGVPYTFDMLSK